MKILFLDIETAPNTVFCWGLHEQDISLDQIIETSYVLCWAAKWLDDDEMLFERTKQAGRSSPAMIRKLYSLINEADSVVTYNGDRFDIPTVNREFLLQGFKPPAPTKTMDLFKTVKAKFRFASNKLDHVADELGLGGKTDHEGFMLWVKCMKNDRAAWTVMEEYNKNDVVILERLFYRIRPWLKVTPNYSAVTGNPVCPNCGSKHYQHRGYMYSLVSKYRRFQCMDCSKWYRGNINEHDRRGERSIPL